jgi:hypothetical protein
MIKAMTIARHSRSVTINKSDASSDHEMAAFEAAIFF